MRIKHFTNYGSVQARKVSKTTTNNKTKLVVEVKGNHEWGLVRDDIYDVRRWLFNRFEKNFNGQDYEIDMTIEDNYIKEGNLDVEVATYTSEYDKC